jgi:putative ABC transport system permease protein
MSSLPWRTALKLAWRESRSSPAKFLFVVAAVAIGAGSLTGVRGFSQAFRGMLLREARTLMAADLSVRVFQPPSPQQDAMMRKLEESGVRRTSILETVSMVSSATSQQPLLVSIKAVDPEVYPFYGSVRLEPPQSLAQALRPDSAAVSSDLLLRLRAAPGDQVRIGGQDFRIAASVLLEPDRMAGSLNVGPRLLLSHQALERSGLMQPGSRAARRFLFRLGPDTPGVEQVRRMLVRAFREGMVADFRATHPVITRGLNRATTFLSLVSLIALIVGALGVATAMHSHLQQKMDTIAIMKCVGARSGQVLRIYLLQAGLLGLAGSLLGVGLGIAVQQAFPLLIARYFPIRPGFSWGFLPALEGLGIGVLTTLLFTAPPLLSIRGIRPAVVFRRDMAEAKPGWRRRLIESRQSLAVAAALLAGIAGIAAWLTDSPRMSALFTGALVGSLAALFGAGWLLLRGVRGFLRWWPHRLPAVLRHGLANLDRPGNHARAALVALGIGVTFTLTVYLVQRSLVGQVLSSAPPDTPNVFLINITGREKDGILELLRAQRGLQKPPELVPAVSARLLSVDGVPVEKMPLQGPVRRYLRTRQVTWAAEKPAHIEVRSGAWWDPKTRPPAGPFVSVDEDAAGILGVKPGSRLEWTAAGRSFWALTAAIHRASAGLVSSIEFILNDGALEGLPAIYFGALRVRASDVPALQRAAYEKYPTVTVINAAEVLEIVQEVVDQVALVVRFVSAFAILAGAVILASSIAGTRFRRIREVVILKTLGATRRKLAGIFSVEFLVLGASAGLIGSILATAFSGLLLKQLLDADFRPDLLPGLAAIAITALIANAAGWLASFRILNRKPLEALREE